MQSHWAPTVKLCSVCSNSMDVWGLGYVVGSKRFLLVRVEEQCVTHRHCSHRVLRNQMSNGKEEKEMISQWCCSQWDMLWVHLCGWDTAFVYLCFYSAQAHYPTIFQSSILSLIPLLFLIHLTRIRRMTGGKPLKIIKFPASSAHWSQCWSALISAPPPFQLSQTASPPPTPALYTGETEKWI